MNLKKGQVVKYQDIQNRENCVAKVIGRAGKATENNRNWYNLSYLEPDSVRGAEISVDLSKVQDLEVCESEDVMVLTDVSLNKPNKKNFFHGKTTTYILRKPTLDKSVHQHDGFVPLRIHLKELYTKQDLLPEDLKKQIKKIYQKTHPPVVQTLSDLS